MEWNVCWRELGMNGFSHHLPILVSLFMLSVPAFVFSRDSALGLFDKHGDIGMIKKTGSVEYDSKRKTYLVAGGGENMWFGRDAFHFVWKQASGDVSLSADIQWVGQGGNPHRKACLLIRQNDAPGSPYADAVVHGNGLTCLQYREQQDGPTREIQSAVSAPHAVRIEKVGDTVFLSIAGPNEAFRSAGGSFRIPMRGSFLVGLGVCAHDDNALEKAVFSDVEITSGRRKPAGAGVLESTLETVAIASKDRRVIYNTRDPIEAPNWSRDGKHFLFNCRGRIYTLSIDSGAVRPLDTGFADHCNNDHGLSPDGTQLAISDQSEQGQSLIYVLPSRGGTPRRITPLGPSYWHGWSPDGKT
ncbi:MAG TPA: hypothetical protein VGB38_04295, partial [bacterium]